MAGQAKVYEAIVKGAYWRRAPEAFINGIQELRGLALDIGVRRQGKQCLDGRDEDISTRTPAPFSLKAAERYQDGQHRSLDPEMIKAWSYGEEKPRRSITHSGLSETAFSAADSEPP